jgi:hypothetical protein
MSDADLATVVNQRSGAPTQMSAIYFPLLLIGYFESLGSERGIAWRAADSFTLRNFLGLA